MQLGLTRCKVRGGYGLPRLGRIEEQDLPTAPCIVSSAAGRKEKGTFRLHALAGQLSGNHAVSVSGNWRVTFRFGDVHAVNVDYTDYH